MVPVTSAPPRASAASEARPDEGRARCTARGSFLYLVGPQGVRCRDPPTASSDTPQPSATPGLVLPRWRLTGVGSSVMDLDDLAAAVAIALTTGEIGVVEDELRHQGWSAPRMRLTGDALKAAIGGLVLITESRCWLWQGRLDRGGYGVWKGDRAHRITYRAFVGPIPRGLVLDHFVCGQRSCVAPHHLEPVTAVENTRRAVALGQRTSTQRVHHGAKRFCVRGHEFTDANTYRDRHGRRFCRACRALHARRYRQVGYVSAAARDDRASRAAMTEP